MAQFNFEAIGTTWQIDIQEKLEGARETALLSSVMARIEEFDRAYSRFRSNSLVTKMSHSSGTFVLPDDAPPMLALYRDLYDRTGGLFTPLVGDMLSDAGYDAAYSLTQKKELTAPFSWDEVMEYRAPTLVMKRPTLLDFGAAGKGYLVDLVARTLEENKIFEYTIDAGGDMLHKGLEPLRIGLEDPEDMTKLIGVCSLKNGSIAGSAGNRRKWGDFNHIMNPKTLVSERTVLAVWVTASNAMLADALATCLFFVDANTLADAYNFEYVLIRSDRSF
jgi:thiamine biosynthesis lipoprotein